MANPSKPQPIVDILTNNRDKLLKYLEDFLPERGETDERASVRCFMTNFQSLGVCMLTKGRREGVGFFAREG